MEKNIELGTVGGVKIEFSGGKAKVSIEVSQELGSDSVKLQAVASVMIDAGLLVDMIFEAIPAPAGTQAIEDTIQKIVKDAVLSI